MDDELDDELFEGVRIVGEPDEPVADAARPGRSVFDEPEAEIEPGLGGSAVSGWSDEPADDLTAWSSLTDAAPRWRDDEVDDLPQVAAPQVVGGGDGGEDFFSFDDGGESVADFGQTVAADDSADAWFGEADEATVAVPIKTDHGDPAPRRTAPPRAPAAAAAGGERDMTLAIGTGVALAVVALVAFMVGPAVSVVLVTVVLTLAAAEFFNAVRGAGYQPAVLLGLVATASLSLGAYYRGEAAIPAVLFLTVVFGMIWYLTGVGGDSAVRNLGVTFLGVVYVGLLGSFAAVLLWFHGETGMLLTAVILTIAYDVGAFVVGRAIGRSPLSPASPNKTIEGLVGGSVAAVLVAGLVVGVFEMEPFGASDTGGGFTDAILLGLLVAVAAPLGDLCESLLKRDLGIKDMGSVLPGHGGLLDRFDALLFVLPTTYYLGRVILL